MEGLRLPFYSSTPGVLGSPPFPLPLCNSFNRNNNGLGEAEDIQHGSDHSLDSDDNFKFVKCLTEQLN